MKMNLKKRGGRNVKGEGFLATDFSKTAEKLADCLVELEGMGINEVLLIRVVDARKCGNTAVELKNIMRRNYRKLKIELKRWVLEPG